MRTLTFVTLAVLLGAIAFAAAMILSTSSTETGARVASVADRTTAAPPPRLGPRLVREGDAGEGYDVILDTRTGCRYLKGSYGTMLPLINGMSWPDCEPSRVKHVR